MTKEQLNQLPTEVQEKVKDILSAYERVHVVFQNGKYQVSAGIGLLNDYADDYKYVGEFLDTDIFTEEELILNSFNNFHSYPLNYKGHVDYKLVNEFKNAGFGENRLYARMENGNIVKQ